jgi:branched-chain amino acid transport system substrate-binding protein
MKGRLVNIILGSLVVLSFLAGCAQPTAVAPAPTTAPAAAPTTAPAAAPTTAPTIAPAAGGTLKVGVLGPFTGPSASVGDEFKHAVTMAFDAINWTVGSYKIEVVWIDGESDPQKAQLAYEAAITRDNIQVGLLNWDASEVIACMELAAKYKIPHFFAMGTSPDIDAKFKSDPKYAYWMGKGWPTPSKLTINYVTTLEDAIKAGLWTPKEKKAVLYGNDDEWSRGFTAAIGAQLKDAGWEIVGEQYVPVGETDFQPMLVKVKSYNAALMAGTMDDAAGFPSLIKQARDVGVNSLIIADGLGWAGDWYKAAGDASDYVIDQIPGLVTPKAKAFHDDYVKRWNAEPSASAAGLAFDETNFFIKILQQTLADQGSLTSDTIFKEGQTKVWTGQITYTDGILMKEYKFTQDSLPDMVVGQGEFAFPVIQYFSGVGKTVWPPEMKEQDLQIPAALK